MTALCFALAALALIIWTYPRRSRKPKPLLPDRLVRENAGRLSTCPFDDYRQTNAWRMHVARELLAKSSK